MSNENVTNPIPAVQVVNVIIDWEKCTLLSEPSCTDLNNTLQALVDAICLHLDWSGIDPGCLSIDNTSLPVDWVTAISNKLKELCDAQDTEPVDSDSPEAQRFLDVNLCLAAEPLDKTTEPECLIVNPCDGLMTDEDIIQMLVSENLRLKREVVTLCNKFEEMQECIDDLKKQVSEINTNCCD